MKSVISDFKKDDTITFKFCYIAFRNNFFDFSIKYNEEKYDFT